MKCNDGWKLFQCKTDASDLVAMGKFILLPRGCRKRETSSETPQQRFGKEIKAKKNPNQKSKIALAKKKKYRLKMASSVGSAYFVALAVVLMAQQGKSSKKCSYGGKKGHI